MWRKVCQPIPSGRPISSANPPKLTLLQALLVVRLAGLRIGENPIRIFRVGAEAPPPQQQFFQTKIEGDVILRILRLYLVDPSTDRAALHQKSVLLKIEVTPLQAEDFADAKPGALSHHHHRPVRFREMLYQFEELDTSRICGLFRRLLAFLMRTRVTGFLPISMTPHRSAHFKTRCIRLRM